jgi:5'-nucleotidase
VDDDTNSIVEYKWRLIPIDSRIAKPDRQLTEYIANYKKVVDQKYNAVLCKFSEKLTHPKREEETSLGNLFADAFAQVAECDVVFVGSGSIRSKEMGPLVTLQDFLSCFPYGDTLHKFTVPGFMVLKIFSHMMRPENRTGEGECYQVNRGIKAVYDDKTKRLLSLDVAGRPVEKDRFYTICMQGYHFNNSKAYLDLTQEELLESGKSKVVTTSVQESMEEYLRNNQNIASRVEGRLVYQ